jgi:hypothetical protein
MDPFTLIAVIGLGIAAVGTGVQAYGSMQAAEASQDAEKLRKKQMSLDAMRKRREVLREAMLARSTALSNATAQGAEEGTGLQGGFAQIAGQAASNISHINQSEDIGKGIFDANATAAGAQGIASIGQGAQNFGLTMSGKADQLSRIFGA